MESCFNDHSAPGSHVSTFQDEEVAPAPRLQRGLSNALINVKIVTMARNILQKDAEAAMVTERGEDDDAKSFVQTTEFTFLLPDLSYYPEDFKAFLYKDLIDTATLVSLEQSGHLNWWADIGVCQRLLPLVTSGDGNCLLHAASLGMWGLHDRQLILRKLLCDALTNSSSAEAFKRRWRYQQSAIYRQCNLVLSEEEWESDWRFLLQLSSPQPRSVGPRWHGSSLPRVECSFAGQLQETDVVYESLEEMHVFVLAHVLRRPIVVIAKTVLQDVHGEALAPIPFGGIYLPVEWDARQCHSAPLLLTYDLSHFCALVAMQISSPDSQETSSSPLPDAIPLCNSQLEFLPLHFAVDPGPNYNFSTDLDFSLSQQEKLNLIQNYFVTEQICIPRLQRELDSYPEGLATTGIIKADLTKSDSEESGGSAKDQNYGDEFDKKSFPKPVKFITKSFDTIGAKLKNITKTGKAGKTYRKGVGVATQSTRMSNIAAEMFENQGFVVCARLRHRKTGYQDVMVRNYIDSMREKFDAQQVKRREQNAEIRRRSIERINLRSGAVANSHSPLNAAVRGDTGGTQQDLAEATTNQHCIYALPGSNSGSLQRQDTIVTAGKSKFYTVATEEQCPMVTTTSSESRKPNDAIRSNRGILKYNRFSAMPLESLPQDVTLIRRTQLSRKDDQIESSVLPRQGAKKADDLEGAPRRVNAGPTRLISNRHTVVGTYLDAVSDPPPLNRATRYETNVQTDPQKKSHSKSFSDGSNNAPSLDVGDYSQWRLCKAGDCSFYGTYETGFLCSQCFKSGKKPRLCHVANCQNEGDPTQDNLCKRCFQQKTYSFQVQYPMAQTKF